MIVNEDAFRETTINAFVHNQWVTGNLRVQREFYSDFNTVY